MAKLKRPYAAFTFSSLTARGRVVVIVMEYDPATFRVLVRFKRQEWTVAECGNLCLALCVAEAIHAAATGCVADAADANRQLWEKTIIPDSAPFLPAQGGEA